MLRFVNGRTLLESVRELGNNHVFKMAAALSYYAALSLAPLLMITLSFVGIFLERSVIVETVAQEMERVLGSGAAAMLRSVAEGHGTGGNAGKGALASTVGAFTLLFGATGIFVELQDDLNILWKVAARPHTGIWTFARHRLLSLAMVVSIGFLLLVSFLASSFLSLLAGPLEEMTGKQALIGGALHTVVNLIGDTLFFGLIFKVLPDKRVHWRDVGFGALATAVLFVVGQFAIGQYVGRAAVGSAYGAAGSLVVVLVWVYYSSLIVLFGAELTHQFALQRDHGRERAQLR